jgi:hypothetical protein
MHSAEWMWWFIRYFMRCLTSAMDGVGTAGKMLVIRIRGNVLWSIQDMYVSPCVSFADAMDDCAAISSCLSSNEFMTLTFYIDFYIDPISSYPFIHTTLITPIRFSRIDPHNGHPSHIFSARPTFPLSSLVSPLLSLSFHCPLILPPLTHPRSLPSAIHQYPTLPVGLEQ